MGRRFLACLVSIGLLAAVVLPAGAGAEPSGRRRRVGAHQAADEWPAPGRRPLPRRRTLRSLRIPARVHRGAARWGPCGPGAEATRPQPGRPGQPGRDPAAAGRLRWRPRRVLRRRPRPEHLRGDSRNGNSEAAHPDPSPDRGRLGRRSPARPSLRRPQDVLEPADARRRDYFEGAAAGPPLQLRSTPAPRPPGSSPSVHRRFRTFVVRLRCVPAAHSSSKGCKGRVELWADGRAVGAAPVVVKRGEPTTARLRLPASYRQGPDARVLLRIRSEAPVGKEWTAHRSFEVRPRVLGSRTPARP